MLRQALVLLHRWFGLGAAGFLFIAGLTGAIIAWDHELDAWLNPGFFDARTSGEALSPLDLAARLEAEDSRIRVRYLPLGVAPGKALDVFVQARQDPLSGRPHELGYNQVAIDPASGLVQGRREWGKASLDRENLLPFLYLLHYTLHLPSVGGVRLGMFAMGIVAVAWVLDCMVALWISFPRPRDWRRSFGFRWAAGGHRLRFDLHRSGGVWLFPLLAMLAVTSVAMNLEHEVMRPLVALVSPLAPLPDRQRLPVSDPNGGASTSAPLPLSEAVRSAQAEARRRGWTAPPGGIAVLAESNLYWVGFFAPGGAHGDGGLGPPFLYLDATTGAIVGVTEPGQGSAGDVFMQSMLPLHSGRLLGIPGRILLSVMGVATAFLSLTGVWIWARKRRARAVSQRARAEGNNLAPQP